MNPYPNGFYMPMPASEEAAFFARQRKLDRTARKPIKNLDIAAIANVDNLAAVYDLMRRENGPAPGPDGMRFCQVGRREMYALLRVASKALLDGTYRPGPAREVKIPKAGNRGFRTLTLRNVIDRVVAKAVNEALVPFWERIFLDADRIGTQALEAEAVRRAYHGILKPHYYMGEMCGQIREYSDPILMFLLRARLPKKYRDNAKFEHLGKTSAARPAVKIYLPDNGRSKLDGTEDGCDKIDDVFKGNPGV